MAERIEARGLTREQVEASRRQHGANVFTKRRRKSFWQVFISNLNDPVIKVLLLALAFHLILLFFHNADWVETVGIALSILLATMISSCSEYGSEAAFGRLCDGYGVALCRVRRESILELPTTEVVVGDVVLLSAGERIVADGVLLSGALSVDQSPLTGESREIEKYPKGRKRGEKNGPSDPSTLLAGCAVLSGEGEMLVTAVGDATVLGGISGELQTETRESPLKRRLTRLAGQISLVGYVTAGLCALAFLFYQLVIGADFDVTEILTRVKNLPYMADILLHALTLALTVVVVAVPEGLPMMIAVVLSANIRRMIRDHVLVRKPAGLEAAGSMNILFTDKTGTLTRGRLTLSSILTCEGELESVRALSARCGELFERLSLAAHANSGAVRGEREGRAAALGGNATDRALLTAFLPFSAPTWSVTSRLPFDSDRKYAATALEGGRVLITGAPERLLPHVKQAVGYDGRRRALAKAAFLARVQARAAAGERAIMICEGSEMPTEAGLSGELTLLAAVTFADPLRPEAKSTVRTLQGAGVQVVMMTGDSKETAAKIAAACGILGRDGLVLEGRELAAMQDAEIAEILPRLAVICRALPSDKSRLVRISEGAGLVVGMTGDGINDAPALKLSDVGFAMGSGTQVAREAGDVVVLDDNLASISKAVLYGRTIFKSIRKFITLQLIMNFCAVGISIIGPFIGFDSPVTVVQMLWINLIMDTLGGLAFAGEAPMPYYMKEAPKGRDEPILTGGLAARIATLTVFTVALSVLFLTLPAIRSFYRESEGNICLLTAFFALFIFAGVFNCFNARTDRVRMLSGVGKNPLFLLIMALVGAVQIAFVYLGGAVLRTVPLSPRELLLTLALAALVLPIGFLHLCARRLWGKKALY